ncbi:ATP-grasp domain-containing protein [Natranaerofaba carboxydovora]|uniref:ATP-grasp domain-containing protein n=1 Tax=Natranaerofaba carboxydovora TaxID=2742683 RepID=UPI001F12F512|nr:ATP-grasp domain-containing protein [Natranaerofaba carboxydovora]
MEQERKKKILFICDANEIPIIEDSCQEVDDYIIEIETSDDILSRGVRNYLEEMISLIKDKPDRYDGIVGTRDMTSVFSNVICEKTGKPGTTVESMINCQNKYISRIIQNDHLPQNTPKFWLDSNFLREFPLEPPFFVKPVRANVSYLSQRAHSYNEIRELIKDYTVELVKYNQYFLDSLAVTSHLENQLNLETCNKFLSEEIMEGTQVTVNGYVYGGEPHNFGIVKAAFHDDIISFSHHELPYEISPNLEKQINDVTSELVRALGLNNTFYNVELRIDEEKEKIWIVEVNSRAAFQFAKMIERVKGVNLVQWLCDLAVGEKPRDVSEFRKDETFDYCFNFELRKFSDHDIVRTPMATNLEELSRQYPEVAIKNLVDANTKLSDYKQNPNSYRYCILDVPGNNKEDILKKYENIVNKLGYEFEETVS